MSSITPSITPTSTESLRLRIKEWEPGAIRWGKALGITAVVSTRLDDIDDKGDAYVRCDVAGGAGFRKGSGREKDLDSYVTDFRSFLDENRVSIARTFSNGLRRLEGKQEDQDNSLLLVSQDLTMMIPHLMSLKSDFVGPPNGFSFRYAHPEYFQFHEGTLDENELVDDTRLDLIPQHGRSLTETYISDITGADYLPPLISRRAFWEAESSVHDMTQEVADANTPEHRDWMSKIDSRRRRRLEKGSRSRSASQSSGSSDQSSNGNRARNSQGAQSRQQYGQYLDVPGTAVNHQQLGSQRSNQLQPNSNLGYQLPSYTANLRFDQAVTTRPHDFANTASGFLGGQEGRYDNQAHLMANLPAVAGMTPDSAGIIPSSQWADRASYTGPAYPVSIPQTTSSNHASDVQSWMYQLYKTSHEHSGRMLEAFQTRDQQALNSLNNVRPFPASLPHQSPMLEQVYTPGGGSTTSNHASDVQSWMHQLYKTSHEHSGRMLEAFHAQDQQAFGTVNDAQPLSANLSYQLPMMEQMHATGVDTLPSFSSTPWLDQHGFEMFPIGVSDSSYHQPTANLPESSQDRDTDSNPMGNQFDADLLPVGTTYLRGPDEPQFMEGGLSLQDQAPWPQMGLGRGRRGN